MKSELSRRTFLSHLGLATISLPFFSYSTASELTLGGVPGLKVGYSAITWGGNDVQAIKDIAALGFKGIQLRSNILKEYGAKPEAIKELLKQYNLAFPMFSSGSANINTGNDEAVIQMHLDNAKFVKAVGGEFIQVTNSSRPKKGIPSQADLQKYGRLLNEIGKRTGDIGIQTTYHNHMHQLGETPQEVEVILENCDRDHVKLLLDIAHYHQGGGDPVKAIKHYQKRIIALHLKDVRPKGAPESKAYTFVELGQGKVDLPGVFKTLEEIKFKGWGIVELDAVPEKEKSPRQCAEITRAYLQTVGIKI
ncbi:sugar phosphate isomerase/epimerase [Pedobacter sp. CG_S7]|uniref:sugar phosphate isomerase/epimerase family protein n=1 Tax=Pedobacter sp. CG_S7 TaxID=3143930 RepID=UPI003397ED0C